MLSGDQVSNSDMSVTTWLRHGSSLAIIASQVTTINETFGTLSQSFFSLPSRSGVRKAPKLDLVPRRPPIARSYFTENSVSVDFRELQLLVQFLHETHAMNSSIPLVKTLGIR